MFSVAKILIVEDECKHEARVWQRIAGGRPRRRLRNAEKSGGVDI